MGSHLSPPMPLTCFHGFKTFRKMLHDLELKDLELELKDHKSVHSTSALGCGNSGLHPSFVKTERLDCIHRFVGCISSCPDSPSLPKATKLHLRWQGLSILGRSLGASACPKAVYSTGFLSGSLPKGTRHQTVVLSG